MNLMQELVKKQINQHGVDRYPTIESQTLKIVEEIGELAKTVLQSKIGTKRSPEEYLELTVDELCDVFLAAAELANKLGVNIYAEALAKVENDMRKF